MKKKHFSWALVAALSFGCMFTTACSDDDPVQTEVPNPNPEPSPEPNPETLTRFVIVAQAGSDNGATYLVTSESLDEGQVTADGRERMGNPVGIQLDLLRRALPLRFSIQRRK